MSWEEAQIKEVPPEKLDSMMLENRVRQCETGALIYSSILKPQKKLTKCSLSCTFGCTFQLEVIL